MPGFIRPRRAALAARPALVGVPLLVLSLTLAGCAGPSPDDGATASASASTPLDTYLTALYGTQSGDELSAQNAAVQQSVAACMKEQGFEYVPDASAGSFQIDTSENPELQWGSEEFAKHYGYGITTDPFAAMSGGNGAPDDADEPYLDSLSPSEREAYNEALWGPVADDDLAEGSSPAPYDWTQAGCMGAAQHDVDGAQQAWNDPEFSALLEQMNALGQTVADDPEVVAEEADWSDCLASAGYPGYQHKDDPQQEVVTRNNELTGADVSMNDGGITRMDTEGGTPDSPELQELRDFEIAIATADFGCARSSGYEDAMHRTRIRLEQEFIDANRSQLDALMARYGKG